MRSKVMRILSLWVLFSLIAGMGATSNASAQVPIPSQTEPFSPESVTALTDTPAYIALDVTNFDSSADPLLYWVKQPSNCSGGVAPTSISRTRITGWEPRAVYIRLPGQFEECPYRILSNVVSDGTFIYWVDRNGLQRLAKDASLIYGAPELLLPQLSGGGQHELLIHDDMLYGLHSRPILVGTGSLWSMPLDNPGGYSTIATDNGGATTLRWDGTYLYAVWGQYNELRRYNLDDGSHLLIAYEVSSYQPTGRKFLCGLSCTYSDYTYFIDNYHPNILYRYDAETGAYYTLYTATPQPGKVATLHGLTTGYYTGFNLLDRDLFFFERQETPGSGTATDTLQRKIPGQAPFAVYVRTGSSAYRPEQLQRSTDFVLWKEIQTPNANNYGHVLRLPMNASALPVVNLRITGYELTQGVQRPNDGVFYVQRRPTFFRLYVKSDGADVPNVTARLTGYSGGVSLGTILPSPLMITVPQVVNKINLAKQFIFELPLDWTTKSDLRLVPYLNPFGFPLEPTFSDNTPGTAYGPFAFLPQPGLRLTVVSARYNYGGTSYAATDEDAIVSWLSRAYPTGLGAVEYWWYDDNELGRRVMEFNTLEACQYLDRSGDGGSDNRNLCASYYLHGRIAAMRRAGQFLSNSYIYVSVPRLPRGSASPTDPVANGPDTMQNGFPFEQAGFYAGHEIGHLLGRKHPVEYANVCGHSASDPDYPYLGTWIGDPTHRTTAFDSGVMVPGVKRSASEWFGKNDMMGYCNLSQQWLSDYTYRAIYLYARQFPGPVPPARPVQADVDDWLTIAGAIAADGSTAGINSLLRTSSMVETPPQEAGDYTIRLLNGSGAAIANYAFAPMMSEDSQGEWMNFVETVPFAAGTRRVQVLSNNSGEVLAEQTVSASAPVISNVSLPGAISPLEGTVTLAWQASDPDGGILRFDLLYSANGGDFKLLASGLRGSSYTFDTAELSGGDGVFRVIASDGVNTAQADSASFPVVMKAPTVHILSPVEGQQIQYGQPINLVGYAQDPQDGMMEDASNLLWMGPDGPIDVGPMIGLTGMDAAGTVEITLQATNSMGISAEKTVQIVIGDELGDPPPSMSVTTSSVALQAPNGDNSPLSGAIGIWNAGGPGTITWEASLNPAVDWLQVDSLSGTAPYTMTLTADPSALAADTIYNTTLMISGSDGQSVPVPVSLQTGAGFIVDGVNLDIERKIYLPMMFRR